jgi:hypothetical protein
MYCERCRTPGAKGSEGERSRRRAGAAHCARCGARLSARPAALLEATVDTKTHLARFGLSITGDPLLELKRRVSAPRDPIHTKVSRPKSVTVE